MADEVDSRKRSADTGAGEQSGKRSRDWLPPRPADADGTFLRILTINDVYELDNFPHVASAVDTARKSASSQNCVVRSHLNGDFLSPTMWTALDGGRTMMEGINAAKIDYVCLGNHEFDMTIPQLNKNLALFKGTVINSNVAEEELRHLPRFDILEVGERKAVIAGVCTDSKAMFSPPMPKIKPVTASLVEVYQQAQDSLKGASPSLFLPMTHQFVTHDEKMAKEIAETHADMAARMPIILGGHDHKAFVEKAGQSEIVKMGQDADKIGIVDLWWTASGALKSQFTQIDAKDVGAGGKAEEFVARQREKFDKLMEQPLFRLSEEASSKCVRSTTSKIASQLLDFVKRGLTHAVGEKVDIALLNAGNVRGDKDYEPGPFKVGDLYKEHPLSNDMAIVSLPGRVLKEAVQDSRKERGPVAKYLHLDSDWEFDIFCRLCKVGGEPIELDREYKVAILVELLLGMDNIGPLNRYVKTSGMHVPVAECCWPAKVTILQYCMLSSWRKLLDMPQLSAHPDERLELEPYVEKAFKKLDLDGDGEITKQECFAWLREKDVPLVEMMFSAIDANQDGKVSREEIQDLATLL